MKNKRILVIDDNEAIRKSFTLALEDADYSVDTAESGQKGIELAKLTKYDLIFLDLKMPGMNGVDTLRELRKMDPKVPVFILTAFYKEFFGQLKELEEDGIEYEILNKPIGSDQIVFLTKSVLQD